MGLLTPMKGFFLFRFQTSVSDVCAKFRQNRLKIATMNERTDYAVENDGSLVIGEFVDGCGVQFWSCRCDSNCDRAKR